MATSLENGVRAAILATRQCGEYHFPPLAGFVAFKLSETVTKVTLLDSQPGTVEHGQITYQNGVAQACHAIADYSPSFELSLSIFYAYTC
ncbi:hypothetical protein PTI98_011725 [Pleurotus ostreatus]|nr:hypothetical protein PTI98_011725 [Pleurotus ostreatus]